ncbi:MAG: hypothetical protein AAFY19_05425, partial [Pseudomonadota bacterium]
MSKINQSGSTKSAMQKQTVNCRATMLAGVSSIACACLAVPAMATSPNQYSKAVEAAAQNQAGLDDAGQNLTASLPRPMAEAPQAEAARDAGQSVSMGDRTDWQTAQDELGMGNRANNFEPSEGAEPAEVRASNEGMQITVDHAEERSTESPYSVKVRTDETHVEPVLAIGLVAAERTIVRGEQATFISYTNYSSLVGRGELRVFRQGVSPDSQPLAVIPADDDGVVRWTPDASVESELFFVYRVYDSDGAFDQTYAHELTVLDEAFDDSEPPAR